MAAWELVFLGTGSAYPSPHRGASCAVLRSELVACTLRLLSYCLPRSAEAGLWMFDCGEGTQTQLMRSSLRPGRLSKIFITHLHGDHLFGLPGLLCTISQSASSEERPPVDVYGPLGIRKFLRTALHLSRSVLGFRVAVHELCHQRKPEEIDGIAGWNPSYVAEDEPHPQEIEGRNIHCNGQGYWEVCREGGLSVCAATLKHRVACFGFVVTEDPLPGKLQVEKLKALGVPLGPLCAKLKLGETVTTPTGREVTPDEVLGPARPGRKLVVLGDTADSSDIVPLADGADVVVHEATNEEAHEDKARANGHSTPGMAAKFCHEVGGGRLILTHFSQRYRREEGVGQGVWPGTLQGEATVDKLLKEAEEALIGTGITVEAADDFKTFAIPAKKT